MQIHMGRKKRIGLAPDFNFVLYLITQHITTNLLSNLLSFAFILSHHLYLFEKYLNLFYTFSSRFIIFKGNEKVNN
jgi:hypothetical protein